MKITISGPAAVVDVKQNVEVLDPQILRRFDGLKSDETCVDYLDEGLGGIGLIGGHLQLVFDQASQRLRVCAVYHSPRELKKKELAALVDETKGQCSDGIGENGIESGDENFCIDMSPLATYDEDFQVEQIDDGVKVPKPRKSPLFAAVMKNDVARIAKLLDDGEDINSRNRHKQTPLAVAVDENLVEAARLLIERGADLKARVNAFNCTPLANAAMRGQIEILTALLQAGADPNYCDPDPNSDYYPLHMACNRSQTAAAKLLVEHGANVNQACHSGYTPIMHLKSGDVELARFLVEHGADVNAVNAFDKGMDQKLKQAIV